MAKNREVGVRLSVKDEAIVKRALTGLGKDGEAAFRRIIRSAEPASTSILALNAATQTARGGFSHFFGGFTAGILPVLTLGAAINGARAALDQFGDVADKSKSAGIDSEFFQGLAYQAKLAGVDIGTLSGALDTFNKNAGQAAEGRGKMVAALKGENAELLRNLQLATSQEERLRLVADALSKIEDSNKKAALAAAVFGDAGTDLVAVFEGGAAAIDATIGKARELGIIVDRDTIAKADELGDKFDTVSQIIDAKLKTALVNLGPTLVWLLELANNVIDAVDTAFQAGNPLRQQSTKALEEQLAALRELDKKAKQNPGGFRDTYFQNTEGPERLRAIEQELFRRADQKSVDKLTLTPPPGSPLPTLPLSDEAKKNVKEAEALIKRLRNETEIYADTMVDLKSKLDAGLITQETFNRGQAEAALKFAKAADDADEYAAALARIEEAHRQGLLTEQQYTDAVESLTKKRLVAQNDWAAGIQLGLMQIKEGAKDVSSDVAAAVTGWADQLGEQIGEAARTGKFAWQDLIKSMGADLAKLATQQLITRPLAGLLGSVAGSLFGGGGLNPVEVTGYGFGRPLAGGGDITPGAVHLVGEKGPELFMSRGPGTVVPNHKLGGNTTVNLNATYNIEASGLSQSQLLAVMEANNDRLLSRVSDVVKGDIKGGKWG